MPRFCAILVVVAAAALLGCAPQQEQRSGAPGAQGPVIIHQWDDPDKMPLELIARTINQQAFGFKKMTMEPVLARMPQADGTVLIASPQALYVSGSKSSVTLQGPVKLIGVMHGEPVVGRAEGAEVDQRKRTVLFTDVELFYRGVLNTAPKAVASQGNVQFIGRMHGQSAPAALVAALYALPRPLEFPPLRTDLPFGE